MEKRTNVCGIIGFIFSIVSILFICLHPIIGVVFSAVAIILSAVGMRKGLKVRGLGIAGLVISIIVFVFSVFCTLAYDDSSDKSSKSDNNSSDTVQESQSNEKEYVTDSIDIVSSDPNSYKDKYITFNGCSLNTVQEDNDAVYYQIYTDLDYNNSAIVEVPKNVSSDKITSDYVVVDGQIKGTYSGQTIVGVDKDWVYIIADSITPADYISTFGKADTTWSYSDKIIEQNGISVQITQVDFNSTETRVYVTVTNNSSDKFNLWDYNAKIVQNGQQYDTTYNYNADYPSLSSDILAGASSSGIIVFPPLEPSNIQLQIEGSSDDWQLDFEPFSYDLTAQ